MAGLAVSNEQSGDGGCPLHRDHGSEPPGDGAVRPEPPLPGMDRRTRGSQQKRSTQKWNGRVIVMPGILMPGGHKKAGCEPCFSPWERTQSHHDAAVEGEQGRWALAGEESLGI